MRAVGASVHALKLPSNLGTPLPTEARNLQRDQVRLLVTQKNFQVDHTQFFNIHQYLNAGDVLVVNISATTPASLTVRLPDLTLGRVHLSTRINSRQWVAEVRKIEGTSTIRWKGGVPGMRLSLSGNAEVLLYQRYQASERLHLWIVELSTNGPVDSYLRHNGRPIEYQQLDSNFPLAYYQSIFSFVPGSAEMPSAGRAFTAKTVQGLLDKGIIVVPILLHTGISSLEIDEKPHREYMEIDPVTAATINSAKSKGNRIVAVGTTAVRAVESSTDRFGNSEPFRGHTELYINQEYRFQIINGLLTGFHEPRSSHLHMLQALAGSEHLEHAYQLALEKEYFWHHFGDLHLLLP